MDADMLTGGGPDGHEHLPYVESRSHRHSADEPEHWHDEYGWSTLPTEGQD